MNEAFKRNDLHRRSPLKIEMKGGIKMDGSSFFIFVKVSVVMSIIFAYFCVVFFIFLMFSIIKMILERFICEKAAVLKKH